MDAKYRDTIPTLIKDLPAGALSDGECASAIATVSKKGRKSKKTNIGKNGLYAGEDVNVTRWWLGRDMSSLSCESSAVRDNVIKTTVSEQRARETQLQIILILEALALEKPGTESIPDQNHIEADPGRDESQKGIKKPKKPQDLTTLLELLADRLSIWQSMNVDESNPSIKESRPAQHQGRSTTEAPPNDSLQQFCIHVVLPLYVVLTSTKVYITNGYQFWSSITRNHHFTLSEVGWPKTKLANSPTAIESCNIGIGETGH